MSCMADCNELSFLGNSRSIGSIGRGFESYHKINHL